jgi:2-C-methyl-D-erythritol 2,4-cyclodiphosphate synthase
MNTRIGFGYDVHRLVENRKLILGGIEIPFEKGLIGHSDADVLIHAIADSLLGAIGKEDIGTHFPDTSDIYKGISSMILLKKVAYFVHEGGFIINNIDTTIVLEKPKISSYFLQMRDNISQALNIGIDEVNIKATTNESLGDIGKGQGAAAFAVSIVRKP